MLRDEVVESEGCALPSAPSARNPRLYECFVHSPRAECKGE